MAPQANIQAIGLRIKEPQAERSGIWWRTNERVTASLGAAVIT
jgi:hypothetical protein